MVDWYSAGNPGKDESDPSKDKIKYDSRRSPFFCRHGCVSTSQPLASSIGLQLLLRGGNAADVAVGVAAALAVLEPCSTGLGGDMFALYYQASNKEVYAINGSGKCPQNLSLDQVLKVPEKEWPRCAHAVTVPMAARGWEETFLKHGSGKLTFAELLEPAAQMAEEGFPIAYPCTSTSWSQGYHTTIAEKHPDLDEDHPLVLKSGDRGQIKKNPHMAQVLRDLGENGATKGFYQGRAGVAIVNAVQHFGGVMTEDDLSEENTQCTFPRPIHVEYANKVKVWQVPPNGQGIAGLIAIKSYDLLMKDESKKIPEGDTSLELHAMIECTRYGFHDARTHVCDPDFVDNSKVQNKLSNDELLSTTRLKERLRKFYDPEKATAQGMPDPTSCTVSFQVVDKDGNAISFVNSNFMGFGTGIVPRDCGFTLQNRGFGFSLDPNHLNALKGGKRPYHTIIPGIITHSDNDDLYATISNMGGYMQPQGHFQLTMNLVTRNMDPQEAIDYPRFCIADGTYNGRVLLERGFQPEVIQSLEQKGHTFSSNISGPSRAFFGRAQIIHRDRDTGLLTAGSDGRADGCAMGY